MSNQFVSLIIAVCVLIGLWIAVDYFSPHPLVTTLCKIALFVIALILVVTRVLPMVGIG